MASMASVVRSVLGAVGNHLKVSIASGDVLDVRQYSVHQRMSALFQVSIVAVSESANVDFDAVVGREATFTIMTSPLFAGLEPRRWKGICNHIQQVGVETDGASTYQLSIVPALWLATQRRNHRMFQQSTEPDIAIQMLKEWGVEPDVRIDKGAYKKRKYRVQYGESDFAFLSRMLEDAGVSFYFEQQGEETKLVLSDSPEKATPRVCPIPFNDSPTGESARGEHVTAVRVGQQVRPGKMTLRDHDYRLPPSYKLAASASGGQSIEDKLERFHYTPGAFLFGTDKGEASPSADDRGRTRTDEGEAAILAQKRLDAKRGDAKVTTFETNVLDLAPGVVMSIIDHPRAELSAGKSLLVVEISCSGTSSGEGACHVEARSADKPYRPPLVTPRPQVNGVESATVVGPPGEEIHTDEFGRVRVHFHWDRESAMDEKSSCWIHVSQPWGGSGYGGMNLPRIGQEVLVDFLGGDPDRPVIVGRLYTNLQKVPYKLPANKTQSGWRSNSTNKTGGYNEIMFEDAAGRELVNIQAEKDMKELVKHDATHTVKNDRTTTVWKNDSSLIGAKYEVVMSPSSEGAPSHGPTKLTMVHDRIELTTGDGLAGIIIEGPNIVLKASGAIGIFGDAGAGVFSSKENVVIGAKQIVKIDGEEAVLINCTEPPPQEIAESGPGVLGVLGAVALGVGVAAAIIAAPVVAGVIIGAVVAGAAVSR